VIAEDNCSSAFSEGASIATPCVELIQPIWLFTCGHDDGGYLDVPLVELAQPRLHVLPLTEETWQFNKVGLHQWEKSRDQISRDYGLAASTWSRAKDGLLATGLLAWDLGPIPGGSRMTRVPRDRYTVHAAALSLSHESAPMYSNVSTPVTVKAPRTGKNLRLHHQKRIEVGRESQQAPLPEEK
jgi:hypothetical protein